MTAARILFDHRRGEHISPRGDSVMQPAEQRDPLGLRGSRVGRKRPLGRGDGSFRVDCVAQAHLCDLLLGGGVEQVKQLLPVRGDELAVDVDRVDGAHSAPPLVGGLWCELLGHSIVVGKSVERQS